MVKATRGERVLEVLRWWWPVVKEVGGGGGGGQGGASGQGYGLEVDDKGSLGTNGCAKKKSEAPKISIGVTRWGWCVCVCARIEALFHIFDIILELSTCGQISKILFLI